MLSIQCSLQSRPYNYIPIHKIVEQLITETKSIVALLFTVAHSCMWTPWLLQKELQIWRILSKSQNCVNWIIWNKFISNELCISLPIFLYLNLCMLFTLQWPYKDVTLHSQNNMVSLASENHISTSAFETLILKYCLYTRCTCV